MNIPTQEHLGSGISGATRPASICVTGMLAFDQSKAKENPSCPMTSEFLEWSDPRAGENFHPDGRSKWTTNCPSWQTSSGFLIWYLPSASERTVVNNTRGDPADQSWTGIDSIPCSVASLKPFPFTSSQTSPETVNCGNANLKVNIVLFRFRIFEKIWRQKKIKNQKSKKKKNLFWLRQTKKNEKASNWFLKIGNRNQKSNIPSWPTGHAAETNPIKAKNVIKRIILKV